MLLGDSVEKALSLVGVTESRVSRWLNKPCKCGAIKEKLNKIKIRRLNKWAARV